MAGQLVGFDQGLTMSQDGKWHKDVRRVLSSVLNPGSIKQMEGLQAEETAKFVRQLLKDPTSLRKHIRHFSSSIVLRVAYGYVPEGVDDPMVAIATKALTAISSAGTPGKWLVDVFPVLRYVPYWLPGAGFKRKAIVWRTQLFAFYHSGFDWVQSQLKIGNHPSCYLTPLLSTLPECEASTRSILLHSSAAIYGGGSDTISSALATFFLYMSLHPEIQHKAQSEIDAIIGSDRLPTAGDQLRLPYTSAILKECLRILPPAPLGVPHCVRKEDEYLGYRIPEGTVIYANIWRVMHDPRIYDDPFVFRPERHLSPSDSTTQRFRDPSTYVFGFGRRVCPGQHLAESTLFGAAAATLAVFEIGTGEKGSTLPRSTTGAFSHPGDFECMLRSRGEEKERLLQTLLDRGEY